MRREEVPDYVVERRSGGAIQLRVAGSGGIARGVVEVNDGSTA